MKQESRSSSGEISVLEREDAPDSDISPMPMSNLVDDGSGQPDEIQANKNPKKQMKRKPR